MSQNKYILDMFPYPSGNGLHVGHTVGYLATDIYSRHLKRKGYEVFHPFGFDSFGLPTEQYALKTGKDPKVVTEENIKRFKEQLDLLDLDLNWEAQIITSEEKYYKWTQWIFTKLYTSWYNPVSGKAESIDTCPHTDLDNYRLAYKKLSEVNWCEELGTVLANDEIEDEKSIRGGHPITKKEMLQWFLRITPYSDRLINDLTSVEWKNKQHQINFIGRSEGFEIDFEIQTHNNRIDSKFENEVYSSETVTVFTTKPETLKDVEFLVTSKNSYLATEGKEGEYFTGYYAIVPVYNKIVPIWVADYVVDGYGTGFVMGVPCDDKRDRDFGFKYELYNPQYNQTAHLDILEDDLVTPFIKERLIKSNYGREKVNYKLHDITFSRQRKWGEPIPLEGETDTMPSYAGSNWYFFRYLDAHNENFFCDLEKQKKWLPVDLYVGGSEHTTGHVLYARFITKFLYDLGYSEVTEPFKKIINVGLMNGSDGKKMSKSTGNVVTPDEVIEKWGVDAFRLWISFIAPFEQSKLWKEDGIKGCAKFLKNFEKFFEETSDVKDSKQEELLKTLDDKVTKDIERFSFNTAVPHLMKFVNEMSKFKIKNKEVVWKALDIMEPFTPNFVKNIKNKYSF
jgi:leucyl-tRNA synthetase